MKKRKLFVTLVTALVMMLMSVTVCFAENTDDYTYAADEPLDFCVFNVWAENFVDPPAQNITNIQMTVEVSEMQSDPITVKMYSKDQVEWVTWKSEPQEISADGTYTFLVEYGTAEPVPPDKLGTIYIKDPRCCVADEDPEGQELEESGFVGHVKLVSVEYNVAAGAAAPETSDEASVETSENASGSEVTENADATEQTTADKATTEKKSDDSKKDDKSSPIIIIVAIVAVVAIALGAFVVIKKK